jgi:hypothetical protein
LFCYAKAATSKSRVDALLTSGVKVRSLVLKPNETIAAQVPVRFIQHQLFGQNSCEIKKGVKEEVFLKL